jgi:hypothetical protein
LCEAFTKTMNDEALLADAKKKKFDLDPLDGEELEALAKEIMVQPPDVIERVKKVLANEGGREDDMAQPLRSSNG